MDNKKSALALGSDNIWRLLRQYAIPSIIASIAASLYNIVDSIFIGQGVGALAISGLAITFPLMNLSAAFGSLVGVGASTLMSLRLGQKDYSTANNILGNVFVLNFVFGMLYTIVVIAFLDPILLFFGASTQTLPYAREYMLIISLGNVITHLYLGLNALLRAIGKPRVSMLNTICTVVLNIILTPVFIYKLNMGIKGAALATIISQAIMLFYQILLFNNKSNFVHFKKGVFRLKRKIVLDSLAIGISPFSMNAASCIVVIIINQGLINYGGDLHVGAYGIINRVAFLFAMLVMGLNQGMQPIAGYNYGAGQHTRVNTVLKYTLAIATAIMVFGFVTSQLFPRAVVSIFTTDQNLVDISAQGLRIVFFCFPIVGFQMVTSNFFQSIGHAKKSIFMSLSRQVLFLLPCLIILPHFIGVKGVWYSLPLSDFLSSIIAAILLIKQYKKTTIKV